MSDSNKPAEAKKETPKEGNGIKEQKELKEGPCGLPAKCTVQ